MTESDVNKLHVLRFHNGCHLKIFWPAKITNKNIYEISKTKGIRTLLKNTNGYGLAMSEESQQMSGS